MLHNLGSTQEVKGQGHSGIKYAGNGTFWACSHNVLKSISRIFTKLTPMMYYGTEMNSSHLGSKGHSSRSQWNNICWNHHCTGGGIQYSGSRVELDFLVTECLIHCECAVSECVLCGL